MTQCVHAGNRPGIPANKPVSSYKNRRTKKGPVRLHGPFSASSRRRPTFPHGRPCSIIGAGGLNFCVRNGNRCFPSAMVAGNSSHPTSLGPHIRPYEVQSGVSGKPLRRLRETQTLGQAARPISTGQLHPLPDFHIPPINLVVSEGSSGRLRGGRSYLGASFALRCIQRLSLPHLATQRCPWRDNWCTIGASNPVLSY